MAKSVRKGVAREAKAVRQSEFSQPKKRRPFSVFLVLDDRSVRESLVAAMQERGITTHDYMTAMEFYRDYRTPVPGVIIAEIHLRGMSGVELFEKLAADKSDLLVAFIAGHSDAPQAIAGMNKGAVDFIAKPVQVDGLWSLIARAYAMHYDVDWDFVGDDVDDIEESLRRMTVREQEVLDLVVEGLSSREIAERLGISTKTIEAHRARINDKMRADDLAHLVRMVMAYRDAMDE